MKKLVLNIMLLVMAWPVVSFALVSVQTYKLTGSAAKECERGYGSNQDKNIKDYDTCSQEADRLCNKTAAYIGFAFDSDVVGTDITIVQTPNAGIKAKLSSITCFYSE